MSPNYPREGQPTIVEVMQLAFSNLQTDPDILEFLEFPGPFIVYVFLNFDNVSFMFNALFEFSSNFSFFFFFKLTLNSH